MYHTYFDTVWVALYHEVLHRYGFNASKHGLKSITILIEFDIIMVYK